MPAPCQPNCYVHIPMVVGFDCSRAAKPPSPTRGQLQTGRKLQLPSGRFLPTVRPCQPQPSTIQWNSIQNIILFYHYFHDYIVRLRSSNPPVRPQAVHSELAGHPLWACPRPSALPDTGSASGAPTQATQTTAPDKCPPGRWTQRSTADTDTHGLRAKHANDSWVRISHGKRIIVMLVGGITSIHVAIGIVICRNQLIKKKDI